MSKELGDKEVAYLSAGAYVAGLLTIVFLFTSMISCQNYNRCIEKQPHKECKV